MKPGAALAALRRRSWHVCPVCSKRFSGIAKAVYCSNACRQKNKRTVREWISMAERKPAPMTSVWGWSRELQRASVYHVQEKPLLAAKDISHWMPLVGKCPKHSPFK